MNFVDEDTRLEFHKSNTMMQMLCQTFESMCFRHGVVVTVIEMLDNNSAVLGAELEPEAAEGLFKSFNAYYGRIEGELSLHYLSAEDHLWLIHGDEGKNLLHLN